MCGGRGRRAFEIFWKSKGIHNLIRFLIILIILWQKSLKDIQWNIPIWPFPLSDQRSEWPIFDGTKFIPIGSILFLPPCTEHPLNSLYVRPFSLMKMKQISVFERPPLKVIYFYWNGTWSLKRGLTVLPKFSWVSQTTSVSMYINWM